SQACSERRVRPRRRAGRFAARVRAVCESRARGGGRRATARRLHRFLGPPLHGAFAELAGESLADACVEAYRSRYRDVGFAESTVVEGMDSALAVLREPAIVVTSKPVALAEPLLRAVGLRDRFAAMFGPSLDERAEPKAVT